MRQIERNIVDLERSITSERTKINSRFGKDKILLWFCRTQILLETFSLRSHVLLSLSTLTKCSSLYAFTFRNWILSNVPISMLETFYRYVDDKFEKPVTDKIDKLFDSPSPTRMSPKSKIVTNITEIDNSSHKKFIFKRGFESSNWNDNRCYETKSEFDSWENTPSSRCGRPK